MQKRKTILVTGGGGFIGSHLCERLLADGNDVVCVDNFYTGTSQISLPPCRSYPQVIHRTPGLQDGADCTGAGQNAPPAFQWPRFLQVYHKPR